MDLMDSTEGPVYDEMLMPEQTWKGKDGTKPAPAHQGHQAVPEDEDGSVDGDDELYANVPFQKDIDQRTGDLADDDYDSLDIMAAQRADELNGNMPYKGGHRQQADSDESEEEEEVVMEEEEEFKSGRVADMVNKLTEDERTGKKIHGTPEEYGNVAAHPSTTFGKGGIIDKPSYRFQPALKRPTQLATGGRNGHRHFHIGDEDEDDDDDDVYEVRNSYGMRRDKEVGGEDHYEGTEWHVNEHYEGFSISPSHLANRFDSLEVGSGWDDGAVYEDVQFDEGAQGFFIDDDLLYEDLLVSTEDDEPLVEDDDSDSSWGSEEFEDDYSEEDSGDERIVSSYVESGDHSPRGLADRQHGGHVQRSNVTSYGVERHGGKEEPKSSIKRRSTVRKRRTQSAFELGHSPHAAPSPPEPVVRTRAVTTKSFDSYREWVKGFGKSRGMDKVRSLFGWRTMPDAKESEQEEADEEKDDLHFIDVKFSHQKHPPPTLPPPPGTLTAEQIARRHVVQAIIDSEKSYMVSLQRLVQAYEKPLLESDPPLLEREKVKLIFYRVRGIYQCHLMFQIALASRVKTWEDSEVLGDVFVASFSKAMVLEMYSAYVNNFTNAMETAKKAAAQKPAFREFIESRQMSSSDRLSLYGLMVKPIQRFPQFICLLQDLLKRTPSGHADRMPLQLALTKLETLAGVLNDRKKQTEQKHAVKQLIKNLNVKLSHKLPNDRIRWVVRQDDMLQTVYDVHGQEIKCKERRLFMLNDLLVCSTVVAKSSLQGMDIPKYKHKWSVPLSQVEVVESSVEGGEVDVKEEPGRLTITAQPIEEQDYQYGGSARKLYQERNNLLQDLAVIRQIGALYSTLKNQYSALTRDDIEDWMDLVHNHIQRKGREIKHADFSKIQLSLPSVELEERVTLVFDAVSPKIKLDWINALETAKLGLEPHNDPGWYAPEESDSVHAEMNFGVPLLMKSLPVFNTKNPLKVQCAVLCPLETISRSRKLENEAAKNSIWVCSSDGRKAQVSVVGFQPSAVVKETFELASHNIVCMECVPGFSRPLRDVALHSTKRSEFVFYKRSVWIALDCGTIHVYQASQIDKSQSVASFKVSKPVTAMKYLNNRMFIGQSDGSLLIYSRTLDGEWKVKEPRISALSPVSINCLLPVAQNMWCGSGNFIYVVDMDSEFMEGEENEENAAVQPKNNFEVDRDSNQSVQHMVVAGVGVWVSFHTLDIIRLFHTETLQVLQDINVASPIGRMVSGVHDKTQAHSILNQPVHVTSLLACRGSLWVGTNVGVLVNYPLPRLEGVPLVNGPAMVSYHTHKEAVKFLHAMEISRQDDRISFSSKEDAKSPPTSPSPKTPASGSEARTPSKDKASHTANLVTNAMSPMTDYFSLTFPEDVPEEEQHTTNTATMQPAPSTDSGAISNFEESPLVESIGHYAAATPKEQVSANITSTTTLVLCGGQGHGYLMQEDGGQRSKDAQLLIWQVSM
ncbi:rho guanine nucleotide exchange factor 10-like protein [Amphiura filiformis]|uniref:rho guanine nucleotide exchange factor 10-like protein n=1 Tax=Amphiura filiformis TaxID=82378 RepID=UPI003B210A6E